MNASLTDRYVYAATRSVPETQRADLDRELRERIGDATDALVAEGRAPDEAERAALTELGDPAVLAAGYVDRPLHLIGPRYFLTWWRLLKVLYAVVLPTVTAVVLLAQLLSGATPGQVAVATWNTLLGLVVHLGFWTTLVFAVLERMPATGTTAAKTGWTIEQLPQPYDDGRRRRLGELVASLVFVGIMIFAITIWQQIALGTGDGQAPVLDPALWAFWIPYFVVVLLAEAVLALVRYRTGWTWGTAAGHLVLTAAFTVPAIWLFVTGRLFSDEVRYVTGWPWGGAGETVAAIATTVVVVIVVVDVVDAFRKAWLAGRHRSRTT